MKLCPLTFHHSSYPSGHRTDAMLRCFGEDCSWYVDGECAAAMAARSLHWVGLSNASMASAAEASGKDW